MSKKKNRNIPRGVSAKKRYTPCFLVYKRVNFFYLSIECNCPKAVKIKGKLVVDSICDNIGECICPEIEGTNLIFTAKNGCVASGKI